MHDAGPFHFPNNAENTAHPELVEGPPTGGSTSSPRMGFPEISKNEKALVHDAGPFHFPNNADITAHPELVEGPPTGGSTSSPRTGFPEISKNEKALVYDERMDGVRKVP